MARCSSTCPQQSLPAGLPLEVAKTHPRYKHLLKKLRCEFDAGHEGVHSAGQMRWHDPPVIRIGGREL